MNTPTWKVRRRRMGSYPKPWKKMSTTKYHQHEYLSSSGLKAWLGLTDGAKASEAMTVGTLVHEAIEDYLLTGHLRTNRFNGLAPAKKARCLNCVNQAIAYIGDQTYDIVEGSLFADSEAVDRYGDGLLLDLLTDM